MFCRGKALHVNEATGSSLTPFRAKLSYCCIRENYVLGRLGYELMVCDVNGFYELEGGGGGKYEL